MIICSVERSEPKHLALEEDKQHNETGGRSSDNRIQAPGKGRKIIVSILCYVKAESLMNVPVRKGRHGLIHHGISLEKSPYYTKEMEWRYNTEEKCYTLT